MKILKSDLKKFLKKVMMSDKQQILEANLKFGSDGLKIDANSPAKESRIMGWLKKESFEEYTELGNVGINDFNEFIKVIDRFDDKISLKKEGHLLTIKSGSKTVDVELVAENFLSTDSGAPNLTFDETFQITAKTLGNVFTDANISSDAILLFETEAKKLKVSNTGKYKFKNEFDCQTLVGGTKVKFGKPLIDATNELDETLEISIKTDYPMRIQEKTDKSVITIIVAPRVEDSD